MHAARPTYAYQYHQGWASAQRAGSGSNLLRLANGMGHKLFLLGGYVSTRMCHIVCDIVCVLGAQSHTFAGLPASRPKKTVPIGCGTAESRSRVTTGQLVRLCVYRRRAFAHNVAYYHYTTMPVATLGRGGFCCIPCTGFYLQSAIALENACNCPFNAARNSS